jgi:hypothetical protein
LKIFAITRWRGIVHGKQHYGRWNMRLRVQPRAKRNLTHGADPFLRSCLLCSYSNISQDFL